MDLIDWKMILQITAFNAGIGVLIAYAIIRYTQWKQNNELKERIRTFNSDYRRMQERLRKENKKIHNRAKFEDM